MFCSATNFCKCVCVCREEITAAGGFWECVASGVLIQRGRYCLSLGLQGLLVLHKLNFNTDEKPLLHSLMYLWSVCFDITCVYCRKLCLKSIWHPVMKLEEGYGVNQGVLKR